ncbi:hypothetical protein PFICI_12777 [Pestalotiopsis fici W106-1]|uniref:Macro domain-containing protein n=1 Tax=Pestalotiopsis fici (strain W106-1 / CGMCC3.15140) TaxID=1229662 RepID=W3WPP9_PESFW|nr:uncharacterized protein PFICI_12777 [Pestalotiopsis fici W106-1]ETS75833.1 hypothetical protein PFICI_12777 [Pestalotiopsis fici W106-1]
MAPISASDIPSLALLYKLKKLQPAKTLPVSGATPAHNDRVGLIRGDITTMAVDAIVNAAKRSLLGGGGVDGAIHRAAGPGLLAECRTLQGCGTGSAKITDAYDLPSRKVIHTVGPVFFRVGPTQAKVDLSSCYDSCLRLAVQSGVKTIAFSAISTGVYGYPSLDASVVACETVKNFLDGEHGHKLDKVIFVTFEEKDVHSYNATLPRFFPPSMETSSQQERAAKEENAEAEATISQLPDVPKADPSDPDHVQKKQKQND